MPRRGARSTLRLRAALLASSLAFGFAAALAPAAPAHAATDDARADDPLAAQLREANRLHHTGQSDAALARIDAWLAQKPRDAQMRFLKSVIYTDTGRSADAMALLESLSQDYPELPEPHNNLAALYAAAGRWDEARRELETALRLNPHHAAALENLGDVYLALAERSYRRALDAEPANLGVPRKLAVVRTLTGTPAAATRSR